MQALLQILLFPSLRTSNSCNASNFSTSIISLLNRARTFSFASLSRFSILVILLKLKSNHSKLINRSRPFIRNHQMVCITNMGTTFAVEPTDLQWWKESFRKVIKIKSIINIRNHLMISLTCYSFNKIIVKNQSCKTL